MSQQADIIEQITRQVLAALGGSQTPPPAPSAPAPASATASPAPIHPPMGICTGDYSKFPELAGKAIAGVAPQTLPLLPQVPAPATLKPQAHTRPLTPAAAPAAPASAAPQGPVFSGIVTARQLETVHGSVVRLAPSARLTPLAVDFVKQRKLTVERASVEGKADKAATSSTWLWWIDGSCPVVDAVTADLRSSITTLGTRRAPSALPEAVREIARRVSHNRAAGAILFVHAAAQAGCMANRCPSLRAIVGTSGEAVEEGLRFLAANVLIIEYPHHGPRSMRALVERFITAERKSLADIQKLLKELGSCA